MMTNYSNRNDSVEEPAELMGKSLLDHARAIYRYAKAYCEPSVNNDYIDTETRAGYARHLARMLKEMDSLLLMAGDKGVSRFCNREQIDAYIEAAQKIAAPKPVIDFSVLFN